MTDKGDTFIFKPEEPEEKPVEKEKITRTDVDEFTIARQVREYDEEEDEKPSSLPYIAATLGALLVIAIVVLVIFLSSGGKKEIPPEDTAPQQGTVIPAEDEEEEETAPVINEYSVGYNGGKIYEVENGGFSVVFEVYDRFGKKTGTEKIYINSETVIKDQGNKIQTNAFINFIENQAGEIIILDCVVNEDEKTAISITYSSEGYGEEIIEEEILVEEDLPQTETPKDEVIEETPPAEEYPLQENETPKVEF